MARLLQSRQFSLPPSLALLATLPVKSCRACCSATTYACVSNLALVFSPYFSPYTAAGRDWGPCHEILLGVRPVRRGLREALPPAPDPGARARLLAAAGSGKGAAAEAIAGWQGDAGASHHPSANARVPRAGRDDPASG